MQTRRQSLQEAAWGTLIGYLVALAISALTLPAYGCHLPAIDNMQVVGIFTVASVIRGYLMRRYYNHRHGRQAS